MNSASMRARPRLQRPWCARPRTISAVGAVTRPLNGCSGDRRECQKNYRTQTTEKPSPGTSPRTPSSSGWQLYGPVRGWHSTKLKEMIGYDVLLCRERGLPSGTLTSASPSTSGTSRRRGEDLTGMALPSSYSVSRNGRCRLTAAEHLRASGPEEIGEYLTMKGL